jgi:hypothetical protein
MPFSMSMDWRAKSRSRSRMSMDWRAASCSRSRARPEFEQNEAHSHALLGAAIDPSSWPSPLLTENAHPITPPAPKAFPFPTPSPTSITTIPNRQCTISAETLELLLLRRRTRVRPLCSGWSRLRRRIESSWKLVACVRERRSCNVLPRSHGSRREGRTALELP